MSSHPVLSLDMDPSLLDFLSLDTKLLISKLLRSKSKLSKSFQPVLTDLFSAILQDAKNCDLQDDFENKEKCLTLGIEHFKSCRQYVDMHWEVDFHLERCATRKEMGNLPGAVLDGLKTISLKKTQWDAYILTADIYKAMKDYMPAAQVLLGCLKVMNESGISNYSYVLEAVKELIILIPLCEGVKVFAEWKDKELEVPNDWSEVLADLFNDEEYEAVAILVVGECGRPRLPETIFTGLLENNYDVNVFDFWDVSYMLKKFDQEGLVKSWQIDLASWLVHHGAGFQGLDIHFSCPLLHLVTRTALDAENLSLFKLIIKKTVLDELDATSKDGNTALHVLTQHANCVSMKGEIISNALLEAGCLPTIRNKEGKLPQAYVNSKHKLYKILKGNVEKPSAGLRSRVDKLKDMGNDKKKQGHYKQALTLYSLAVSVAQHYRTTLGTSLAILHNNIAITCKCQEDFTLALQAARHSKEADGDFWKAYRQEGSCLYALDRYDDAFDAFRTGYFRVSNAENQWIFVEEMIKLWPEVNIEKYAGVEEVLRDYWPDVLKFLTTHANVSEPEEIKMYGGTCKWTLVMMLICPEYEHYSIYGTFQRSSGLVCDKDMSSAELHTIIAKDGNLDYALRSRSHQLRERKMDIYQEHLVVKVVMDLLRGGARPESLVAPGSRDTPYHVAVRLCLLTCSKDILYAILNDYKPKEDLKKARDKNMCTPLHTLCMGNKGQCDFDEVRAESEELCMDMACTLGAAGVDPKARDSKGKEAVDYLDPGTQMAFMLQTMRHDPVGLFSQFKEEHRIKTERNNGQRQPQKKTEKPKKANEQSSKKTTTKPDLNESQKKTEKPGSQKEKPKENDKGHNKPTGSKKTSGSWEKLKEEGNGAFKKASYKEAIGFYTSAIDKFLLDAGQAQLSETDSHKLAVLYGNRAECWGKLGQAQKFFDDARENVDKDCTWYKGHLRVARASKMKTKNKRAAHAYINCFNYSIQETKEVQKDILKELVEVSLLLNDQDAKALTPVLTADLHLSARQLWPHVCYKFLATPTWPAARMITLNFAPIGQWPVVVGANQCEYMDLNVFYRRDLLPGQKWIPSVLFFYYTFGADLHTLDSGQGDSYFHRLITVIMLSDTSLSATRDGKLEQSDAISLLHNAFEKQVLPEGLKSNTDKQGNTVLHLVALSKGNDRLREYLADYMVNRGVDTSVINKAGLTAAECCGNFNDPVKMKLEFAQIKEKEFLKQANKKQQQKQQQQQQQQGPQGPQGPQGVKAGGQKSAGRPQTERPQAEPAKPVPEPGNKGNSQNPPSTQKKKSDTANSDKSRGKENINNTKPKEPSGKAPNVNKPLDDSLTCKSCRKNLDEALKAQQSNKYDEVYKKLVEIVNNTKRHKNDASHKDHRNTAIERVVTYLSFNLTQTIPSSLPDMNAAGMREVITGLAAKGRWITLQDLAIQAKLKKGQDSLPGFARDMDVCDLATDASGLYSQASKIELLTFLYAHDATLGVSGGDALRTVLANKELQVVLKLLEMGADPKGLTVTPGDTPNHAALRIALEHNNLTLLKKLRDLHDHDPSSHICLDLACVDDLGNTLMHLTSEVKFSPSALTATQWLKERGAPCHMVNTAGQLPMDMLPSDRDRRWPFVFTSTATRDRKKLATTEELLHDGTGPGGDAGLTGKVTKTQIQVESAKKLLRQFDPPTFDFLAELQAVDEEESEDEEEEEEEEEEDESDDENEDREKEGDGEEEATAMKYEEPGEEEGKDAKGGIALEVDAKMFDNLDWDVECTEEVWNLLRTQKEKTKAKKERPNGENDLRKERVTDKMKRLVVQKIQQLASGNWRPNLQWRVQHGLSNMQLYKAPLPGGGCVYWELAVGFSPRRSQGAEGGRIYSELIRVWSIVLRYCDQRKVLKRIISSHRRGEHCIVQKNLKGLPGQIDGSSSVRFPLLYVEKDLDNTKTKELAEDMGRRLFPPASSRRGEFHILKFYSFSSALVSAILKNVDVKIDFPFRVTDKEYAFINLGSEAPILLLGRSGTGKTTCCLYRLWSNFLKYWTRASHDGWRPKILALSALMEREERGDSPIGEEEEEKKKEDTERNSSPECGEAESLPIASGPVPVDDFGLDDIDDCYDDIFPDLSEDDDSGSEGQEGEYLHLHQLFVTKNPVLCREVEKNFLKLQHAEDVVPDEMKGGRPDMPQSLQDVSELSFPLFMTSRLLLLMLDASVQGRAFFPRDEDLGLRDPLPGWGAQDDIFHIIPAGADYLMDSDDDDDEVKQKDSNPQGQGRQGKVKAQQRREVTYEVFAYEVWPKISRKEKVTCHPSLVWTEILSFIKGSYEALHCPGGHLSLDQYLTVGHKRAPNFSGDRDQVYRLYELYHAYKRNHFLFDEADVVFNIYQRLAHMNHRPWELHEIYVDETQDFTQAELALLVALASDPNRMFLTGDTAQGIMRGISFRFKDLSSLFYFARQEAHRHGDRQIRRHVNVPKQVYQLTHNYRSHTGILGLASAVLNVLVELFPESFDRLDRDQGMFEGPKPVLIESCSPSDLALLLTGSRRRTSHIEFGAHQAILVNSEEAKENLPEELKSGVVLTVYEAKGLEFDDILIYNFFSDSQANKEWRVVTRYLEDLIAKQQETSTNEGADSGLVSIDTDVLKESNRPHPLNFDPNQHKVLSSELKQLYTALTRARVNVWMFDTDEVTRKPMFEYFKALRLVRCRSEHDLGQDDVTRDTMFSGTSNPKEWRIAGDRYMSSKLYHVAAECYKKANMPTKVQLALAYKAALEAYRLKATPTAMKEAYVAAGVQFLRCGDLHRAALCFQNAKEFWLAAQAFHKNGKFKEAAAHYQRANKVLEASQCMEQLGWFSQAIKLLVDIQLFDRAIDCLNRYHMRTTELEREGKQLPAVIIENAPKKEHSARELCKRSARHHYEKGHHQLAVDAIRRSPSLQDQLDFLNHKEEFWLEAAEALVEQGDLEDIEKAAILFLRCGETERALHLAKQSLRLKGLTAKIHIIMARGNVTKHGHPDVTRMNLEKAKDMFTELEDASGIAEASLSLGSMFGNHDLIKSSLKQYSNARTSNFAAKLECMTFLHSREIAVNLQQCRELTKCISSGFELISILTNASKDTQQRNKSLSYYGLESTGRNMCVVYPNEFPRVCSLVKGLVTGDEGKKKVELDEHEVIMKITEHILSDIDVWVSTVKGSLKSLGRDILQCPKFLRGQTKEQMCELGFKHRDFGRKTEFDDALAMLVFEVRLDNNLQKDIVELATINPALNKKIHNHQWRSVERLLRFILPELPHPLISTEDKLSVFIGDIRRTGPVRDQVTRYLKHQWNNPGRVGRGKSEDKVKERCKSTAWLVNAGFLELLLNADIDVQKEAYDLETILLKRDPKWLDKPMKYALFYTKNRGKKMLEVMGLRFLESRNMLLGHKGEPQDAYEAFFRFTNMTSALGKRGNIAMMPSLSQLVLWLEVYFLVSYCFVAKAKRHTTPQAPKQIFFMTSTQLASLHLVNTCHTSSKSMKIQDHIAAQNFNQKLRDPVVKVLQRQGHLLNFMVGCNKFCQWGLLQLFNPLCAGDASVCDTQGPNFPLAERLLMLAITALMNIPDGCVNCMFENSLRRELYKLKIVEGMNPGLRNLVANIKIASNYRELGQAVFSFVEGQWSNDDGSHGDSHRLLRCVWEGRVASPIRWVELTSKDYKENIKMQKDVNEIEMLALTSLDPTNISTQAEYYCEDGRTADVEERGQEEEEEDWDRIEERNNFARMKTEEANREAQAALIIVRALRLYVMRKRLSSRKFLTFELDELFRQYTLTEAQCGVCGKQFNTAANMQADDTEESEGYSRNDTHEIHQAMADHKMKVANFKDFYRRFKLEIFHPRHDIVCFIAKTKKAGYREQKLLQIDIALHDFNLVFDQVRSQLEWRSWSKVHKAFEELTRVVDLHRDSISTEIKQKLAQQEQQQAYQADQTDHEERMMDGLVDNFNDPTDLPVTQPQKVAGGQGTRRRGQRQRKKARKTE